MRFASALLSKTGGHGAYRLRSRQAFLGRNRHLNLVVDDADRKAVNFQSRIVTPGSVANSKSPSVPRAADHAFFHVSLGQRRPHVWAEIVDRMVGIMFTKHSNHASVHYERGTRAFGNRPDSRDRDVFCFLPFVHRLDYHSWNPRVNSSIRMLDSNRL